MKKLCATGPGSAMPVVSMITRSNLSLPESRLSLSSPRMRMRSPRTVQHTQPLFISMICSPASLRRISLSTPASPNSFSITAMRWPCCSLRIRLTSVVLPLPKKPVSMVTGTMFSCADNSISWHLFYAPGGSPIPRVHRVLRAQTSLFEHIDSQFAAKRPGSPDGTGNLKKGRITARPALQSNPFRRATASHGCAPLEPFQQQPFQVLAFRKLDAHRVVRRGAVALAKKERHPGVRGGAGDDFLEELGRHAAGAGKSREQPSPPQHLQRIQVDVLVPARRALGVLRRRCELRRVEHDEVELSVFGPQLAQGSEHIRFEPLGALRCDPVQREVTLCQLERGRRTVDREHRARASGQRGEREAAGVAEAIEHLPAVGEVPHAGSVVALIEIEPRLLSRSDVDFILGAVLDDLERAVGRRAGDQSGACTETFELAPLGIGALMDPRTAAPLAQDRDQFFAPSLAARRKELHHQCIRVAVSDEAREPVRLSVHEPHCIGRFRWNQRAPKRERGIDSLCEQIRAGDFRLLEAPDTRPDLRGGAVPPPGEETAVGSLDLHGIAAVRRSTDLGDRAGKDPRVAPQERALASGLQSELGRCAHERTRAEAGQPGAEGVSLTAFSPAPALSFSLAGARHHRLWRGAGNQDGCRPAWSRYSNARAFPAPRAGPRKTGADAWRRSGAAYAGGHAAAGRDAAPSAQERSAPSWALCARRARRRKAPFPRVLRAWRAR